MNSLHANLANLLMAPTVAAQGSSSATGTAKTARLAKTQLAGGEGGVATPANSSITTGVSSQQALPATSKRNGGVVTAKGNGPVVSAKTSRFMGTGDSGPVSFLTGESFAAVMQRFVGTVNSQPVGTGDGAKSVRPLAGNAGSGASAPTTHAVATGKTLQQSSVVPQAKTDTSTSIRQQVVQVDDTVTSEAVVDKANLVAKYKQPGQVARENVSGDKAIQAKTDTSTSIRQQAVQVDDTVTSEAVVDKANLVAKYKQPGQVARENASGDKAIQAKADTRETSNATGQSVIPSVGAKVESKSTVSQAASTGPVLPTAETQLAWNTSERLDKAGQPQPAQDPRKGTEASQKSAFQSVKSAVEAKGGPVVNDNHATQGQGVTVVAAGGQALQTTTGTNVATGVGNTPPAAEGSNAAQSGVTQEEASVVNQIAQQARANNLQAGQRVVINLNPPELGRVRLSLQAEGKNLRGLVEVDNPKALGEIHREAAALVSRLADSGINLRRMEVVLNEPSQQQAGAEGFHSMPRDDQAWQQATSAAQQETAGDRAIEDASIETASTDGQGAVVSDESVNIRM